MQWVLWMIAVAVLGLAAVASSGRLGELSGTVTDTPRPHVPSGRLSGDDLRGLRFAVVPRGYSMDQVDELLDRLAGQLDAESPTAVWPAMPQAEGAQAAATVLHEQPSAGPERPEPDVVGPEQPSADRPQAAAVVDDRPPAVTVADDQPSAGPERPEPDVAGPEQPSNPDERPINRH